MIGTRRNLNPARRYEECAGWSRPGAEEMDFRVIFTGSTEEQRDAVEQLRQGLMCPKCTEPLPARPGVDTIHVFRAAYSKNPADLLDRQLARVALGQCPMCGYEVSPEMHGLMHEGELPDPWKAYDEGKE